MRVYLLGIVVAGLAVYAWRDWFKSLCGLVMLMAVIEYEDMPKSILNIQGLNPWNLLMLSIVVAWLVGRRREGLVWDMPWYVNGLLLLYLGVIVAGFLRALLDMEHLRGYNMGNLISEEFINTVKWVVPGLLLFDGCRTRRRLAMAVVSIMTVYFALAFQVIRRVPAASVLGTSDHAINYIRLKMCAQVGYSSVDMSTALAGACWGILALLPLLRRGWQKALMVGVAMFIAYAQALTGGRAGYVAWGATGLVMCMLRWRKYVLLAPALLMVFYVAFPGATGRMLEGFGDTNALGEKTINSEEVTSDRTLMWPYVIQKINLAPMLGYGRAAMVRTGLNDQLQGELAGTFPHPHNMYLECLLDNGIVGFVPIIAFYLLALITAARLFRDRRNPWDAAVGGIAFSLVFAQLVAGIGSQHFYPMPSTLGMWAAVLLSFRVMVERKQAREMAYWLAGQAVKRWLAMRRILADRAAQAGGSTLDAGEPRRSTLSRTSP